MAPSPAVFVRAVMDTLECSTQGELVDRLGWPASSTSNVSKWLRDVSGPSYEPLMDMLEATGWLQMGPGATTRTGADAVLDQALEEIAGVLERLVNRVSEPAPQRAAGKGRSR